MHVKYEGRRGELREAFSTIRAIEKGYFYFLVK
jgi:hypothetical protein